MMHERLEWRPWTPWSVYGANGLFPSISDDPTYPHQSMADNNSQMKTIGLQGIRITIGTILPGASEALGPAVVQGLRE
jgi:hypothetical protein